MMSGLGDMLKVPQGLTSNMGIGSQLNATKMSGRTNNISTMKKTKILNDQQAQEQILKDMKHSTMQRYESDIYKNQMPQLLDRERQKLAKWQRVKLNQESRFQQELDRF